MLDRGLALAHAYMPADEPDAAAGDEARSRRDMLRKFIGEFRRQGAVARLIFNANRMCDRAIEEDLQAALQPHYAAPSPKGSRQSSNTALLVCVRS